MEEYTDDFYRSLHEGAIQSARVVVPLLGEWFQPRRVVDVGCGTGAWLAVFLEHGVQEVVGIDGPGVPPEMLAIPADCFQTHDLGQPLDLGRTFDLALCLEVAEHLPAAAASCLVDSLTKLAPWVLFSAALPGQGGTNHLNEQWPDYWAERFEARGFVTIDCLRGKLWREERVCWWYAQNLLLFGEREVVRAHPLLSTWWHRTNRAQLSLVHPQLFLLALRWAGR